MYIDFYIEKSQNKNFAIAIKLDICLI